jgi:hypothetical protein
MAASGTAGHAEGEATGLMAVTSGRTVEVMSVTVAVVTEDVPPPPFSPRPPSFATLHEKLQSSQTDKMILLLAAPELLKLCLALLPHQI